MQCQCPRSRLLVVCTHVDKLATAVLDGGSGGSGASGADAETDSEQLPPHAIVEVKRRLRLIASSLQGLAQPSPPSASAGDGSGASGSSGGSSARLVIDTSVAGASAPAAPHVDASSNAVAPVTFAAVDKRTGTTFLMDACASDVVDVEPCRVIAGSAGLYALMHSIVAAAGRATMPDGARALGAPLPRAVMEACRVLDDAFRDDAADATAVSPARRPDDVVGRRVPRWMWWRDCERWLLTHFAVPQSQCGSVMSTLHTLGRVLVFPSGVRGGSPVLVVLHPQWLGHVLPSVLKPVATRVVTAPPPRRPMMLSRFKTARNSFKETVMGLEAALLLVKAKAKPPPPEIVVEAAAARAVRASLAAAYGHECGDDAVSSALALLQGCGVISASSVLRGRFLLEGDASAVRCAAFRSTPAAFVDGNHGDVELYGWALRLFADSSASVYRYRFHCRSRCNDLLHHVVLETCRVAVAASSASLSVAFRVGTGYVRLCSSSGEQVMVAFRPASSEALLRPDVSFGSDADTCVDVIGWSYRLAGVVRSSYAVLLVAVLDALRRLLRDAFGGADPVELLPCVASLVSAAGTAAPLRHNPFPASSAPSSPSMASPSPTLAGAGGGVAGSFSFGSGARADASDVASARVIPKFVAPGRRLPLVYVAAAEVKRCLAAGCGATVPCTFGGDVSGGARVGPIAAITVQRVELSPAVCALIVHPDDVSTESLPDGGAAARVEEPQQRECLCTHPRVCVSPCACELVCRAHPLALIRALTSSHSHLARVHVSWCVSPSRSCRSPSPSALSFSPFSHPHVSSISCAVLASWNPTLLLLSLWLVAAVEPAVLLQPPPIPVAPTPSPTSGLSPRSAAAAPSETPVRTAFSSPKQGGRTVRPFATLVTTSPIRAGAGAPTPIHARTPVPPSLPASLATSVQVVVSDVGSAAAAGVADGGGTTADVDDGDGAVALPIDHDSVKRELDSTLSKVMSVVTTGRIDGGTGDQPWTHTVVDGGVMLRARV